MTFPSNLRFGSRLLSLFFLLSFFTAKAQVLRVKNGAFIDTTGRVTPTILGGTVSGDALVFGNTPGNLIQLPDNGVFNFSGGFTIKGELYFEEVPTYNFVMKVASLSTDFKNGKVNSSWMSFPSEPIFTTSPTQYNYYPVGTELLNGYNLVPVGQWVTVEISYDEYLGVTTTKINGVTDRYHIRYRGKERVWSLLNQPMRFLQNAVNVRVRELSFTSGQPEAGHGMNVYANGLPFRSQIQLTFDQIDTRLPLPIEVTISQMVPGGTFQPFAMLLKTLNRKDTLIPMPRYMNAPMTVKIKTSFLEKDFKITHKAAASPYTGKFPLLVYNVQPADFRRVAGLGFNMVMNDFSILPGLPAANIQRSLDSAQANGMKLIVVANSGPVKIGYVNQFKSHPALYGWYLADEPSGLHMMDTIRDDNNAVKAVDATHPTMVMMNNFNKMNGLDCDIIGVDPSPVPNISMRMVDDAVKAALRASNYTKPVFSVIPHYPQKLPTREELKSMVWLGIIAGAGGIGMFEFDHRSPLTPTGYYAVDHPDHLDKIGSVFREAATWDWLLRGGPITARPTGNLAMHACTKTANGKTYLLVANDSRRAETASFMVGTIPVSLTLNPLEVRMINTARLTMSSVSINPKGN